MRTLQAAVQYDDWLGTVAADDADGLSIRALLEEKGLLKPSEFLVAIDASIGENEGGNVELVRISALISSAGSNLETVQSLARASEVLYVRRVQMELTADKFLGLFKRFNVVLIARGLKISGREYKLDE